MAASTSRGVKEIGAQLLKPGGSQGQPAAFADPELVGSLGLPLELRRIAAARRRRLRRGLRRRATAPDGKGAPLGGATDGTTLAPPLAGSARVVGHSDYVVKVLLHGMTGRARRQELSGRRDGADGHATPTSGSPTSPTTCATASATAAAVISPAQVKAVRDANPRTSMWSLRRAAVDDADAAAEPGGVEGDGKPQPGNGRQRPQRHRQHAVGDERPAGARHVVPDRAAEGRARRRGARRRSVGGARLAASRRPRRRRHLRDSALSAGDSRYRWTGRPGANRWRKGRVRPRIRRR